MRLAEARIDSYGPVSGRRTDCGDGVTVLYGPNESGKTLHLEGILRLLEPGIVDVAPGVDRLDARPAGRVVIEHDGDHHELGDGTALSDVCPVDAASLHNVFVVRDGDLDLHGGHDFYASLTDRLGDVHRAEIEAVQSELKARGRLTARTLNVASNEATNHAGTVRDTARSLAADVEAYVEVAEREGLDELEVERLSARDELRDVRAERERLEGARLLAEYERLSEQLATYRSATANLQSLAAFDGDTLDSLRAERADVERTGDRIEELEASAREAAETIDDTEAELEEVAATLTDLERREPAVRAARERLEAYRTRADEADAGRAEAAKPLAIAAVLAAGAATAAGALAASSAAIFLGGVLLVVGTAAALVHYRATSRAAAANRAREEAVREARDAGLAVDDSTEIPAAAESFASRLERLTERRTRLEAELDRLREQLREDRSAVSDLRDANRRRRRSIAETLESAGVADVDAFAARVAERETVEEERKLARRSLVDRFGEPSADDPDEAALAWERDLERTIEDVDVKDVDPSAFDESRLDALRARESELADVVADLEARLEAHDDQLEAFERRARELTTEPFVDGTVTLESRSTDGLEALAADLEAVAGRIERDAERSRKALEIFRTLESAEEEKITDLFAPDGVGSRTFRRVTDGRYDRIDYDPGSHELRVTRRDGRVLAPEALSSGTADQLYLSTRISLATQLLGGDAGFLLLDDAFLTADSERLRRGFEVLCDLAASGWQIVYFTSKREVGERTVEEFDLKCRVFDALPGTDG